MSLKTDSIERAFEELSTTYEIDRRYDTLYQANKTLYLEEYWLIKVPKGTDVFNFKITFNNFPLSLPKIFLVEGLKNYIPHIDHKNFVCTFDTESIRTDVQNPTQIIKQCIDKAVNIIYKGILKQNYTDFTEEFLSYWRDVYEANDKLRKFLCNIDHSVERPKTLELYSIFPKLLNSQYLLIQKNVDEELFKNISSLINKIEKNKLLYLGEVDDINYQKIETNTDVLNYILSSKPNLEQQLVNNNFKDFFVIFKKKIEANFIYAGWRFFLPASKLQKRLNVFTQIKNNYPIGKEKILGLLPVNISKHYLYQRNEKFGNNDIKVGLIGLGSIGSNLIPFLESINIFKYNLADPEALTIENVNRHLLGFDYVDLLKVLAVKKYLTNKNYHNGVHYVTDLTLQNIIDHETEFINKSDYNFISIGDTNSEIYCDDMMKSQVLLKPIFYIWVEPYLLGGHCVFIHPKTKTKFSDLFVDNKFIYNIISSIEYDARDFKKREVGCASSFVEYSQENVIKFLNSIFENISEVIKKNIEDGFVVSWIGDIQYASANNITINPIYKKISFQKVVNRI